MTITVRWLMGAWILALLLGGCTPTIRGVPLFSALPSAAKLSKEDPIRTYQQYKEAVKAAKENVPASLNDALGTSRLIVYTQEIATLPSEQSWHFSECLARTLAWHGVKVSRETRTHRPEMTYRELAMMEALTDIAVWGDGRLEHEKNLPAEFRVPELLLYEFLTAIAENSPSDAAGRIGGQAAFGHSFTVVPERIEIVRHLIAHALVRRALGATFNRYMWEFRPLNLTSLAIFDGDGLSNEWLGYYSHMIGLGFYLPAFYVFTLPALHGLVDGMVDAAKLAKSLDGSAETQKMLDSFVRERGDPNNFPKLF